MHSPILTQFAVGDTVDGITVEISVTIQRGALSNLTESELASQHSGPSKAIRARVAQELRDVRALLVHEAATSATNAYSTREQLRADAHRAEGRQEANAAKDGKIEALEAEIMSLRGKLTAVVEMSEAEKSKRTRKPVKQAPRGARRAV